MKNTQIIFCNEILIQISTMYLTTKGESEKLPDMFFSTVGGSDKGGTFNNSKTFLKSRLFVLLKLFGSNIFAYRNVLAGRLHILADSKD